MAIYRDALPQLADKVFLTDTGIETTLIFHDGYELPHFAALTLLRDEAGRRHLDRYFLEHARAARSGTGFILESATWRASSDWGGLLGYSSVALAEANRVAIDSLVDLRSQLDVRADVVVSGCIGPRGDGYDGTARMDARQSFDYHAEQVQTFAATAADMVHAMTITYPAEAVGLVRAAEEAVGLVRAAEEAEIPVAISFTVDPTVLYLMARPWAHPTHFASVLDPAAAWTRRLRANALRESHAERDEAQSLDAGDPRELGTKYAALRNRCPSLTVLGGCCGTDVRHLRAIADALTPRAESEH